MMKKLTLIWAMLLLVALSFTFTSCDNDPSWYDQGYMEDHWDNDHNGNESYYISMANTIRGHWKGIIQVQTINDVGNIVSQTLDTEFEFDQYQSNSTGGRGLETDYKDGTLVYQSTFTWYINTQSGEIIVKYDDKEQREMVVFKYNLDDGSFTGTMDSRDGNERDIFTLTRYTYSKSNNTFERDEK